MDDMIVWLIMMVAVFSAVFGALTYKDNRWRAEAVKRGYAEYDSGSGAWRWKNEVL